MHGNSLYDPLFCQHIVDWFKRPLYETRIVYKATQSGTKAIPVDVPAELPTPAGYAFAIGISKTTLNAWRKAHAEFAEAYEIAMQFQEHMAVIHGYRDESNANITKLILNQHGYTEKSVVVTGTFAELSAEDAAILAQVMGPNDGADAATSP